MIRVFKISFLLLVLFANCIFIYSQEKGFSEAEDTLLFTPDFFDKPEPLEITLSFDIKKFMMEKAQEEYLPATLTYYVSDSIQKEKDIRIKARGMSRRRHCFMPPFWLNIKKSNINNQYIEETKKVKVVTICRGNKEYERYLLKEYMIYKMYNVLSKYSYRVRLLKIKYVDTGRKNKTWEEWAFMIEPEELLASRIEAVPIKRDNLNYRHTDSTAVDIMNFFQYMIGNTDFTINGLHNMKLFKLKDHTKPMLIPVAYDFDFAGIVNAEYAQPAEILGIEEVTTRYYLGMCRSNEQYGEIIEFFQAKKDEIFDVISNFRYIDHRTRKETRKYVEEFYNELNNPQFIEKKLKITCRR